MPINTTAPSPFHSWAAKKGFDLSPQLAVSSTSPEEAPAEARLLMLCAKVVPSKDSGQLFHDLGGALELARNTNLTNFGPLRHLMTDQRLPGWLRLAMALSLGDSEQVNALARHTPTLAERYSDARPYGWVFSPKAFNSLSATRRLRLLGASLRAETQFTPDEIIATLKEVQNTSWTPTLADIRFSTAWGDDFPLAIEKLEIIAELAHFDPESTLSFAAGIFASTKQMDASVEDLRYALDLMAGLLLKIERNCWPTAVEELRGENAAALLLLPSSPRDSHYRHLAALCSYPKDSRTASKLHPALLAALVHPDSSWALPDLMRGAESVDFISIITSLLQSEGNESGDVRHLAIMLGRSDLAWLNHPEAESLYRALGDVAVETLSGLITDMAEWHPGVPRRAIAISSLPNWVIEEIIDGHPARGRRYGALIGEVHAHLITEGYAPLKTDLLPAYQLKGINQVITALRDIFVEDDITPKRTTSKALADLKKYRDLAAAWLRRMDANQLGELIEFVSFTKPRMGGTDELPGAVTEVIEEALALCTSEKAQMIVLSALDNPEHIDSGHSMTLAQFAKEISATVEKTKA